MEGMVTLSRKEQRRVMVLNLVEKGRMRGWEAAMVLAVSLRHVRRLLAAYRAEGARALAHGNRGRKPPNRLDNDLRQQVIEWRGRNMPAAILSISPSYFPSVKASNYRGLRHVAC